MATIGSIDLGPFPLMLAPMEDVTDPPFRALCKSYGCDIMYTEFISAEGLIRQAHKSVQKLDIYPEERPIGIQIFGDNIDSMQRAAEIAEAANPTLIDINYGCPVKKVAYKGAGAGILRDLPKMQAMTKAIVDQVNCPVTVKTRLGWDADSIQIVEVAKRLQDVGIQGLTIHGRTRKQMYKGTADWSWIGAVKRDPSIHIPIFGNGDIDSPEKAVLYKKTYGVDGLMIGRAAIGNPWIFKQIKHYVATGALLPPPTLEERLTIIEKHLAHSVAWKGERVAVLEMRRHYTHYLRGLRAVKAYRIGLVQAASAQQVLDILQHMRKNSSSNSSKSI